VQRWASRDRLPEKYRTTINALIEDLTKGHGAKKPTGGDRRSEKAKENQSGGTTGLITNGTATRTQSKKAETLAARLAESTEPKVRKAWEGYSTS